MSEGPTDHVVLTYVLAGYFDDPNIVVVQYQPPPNVPGGWREVLRFLESDEFLPLFGFNDYVVIQIDTDRCEEPYFKVAKKHPDGTNLTVEEVVAAVRARLISVMGQNYEPVKNRVLFAISVEEIECWLLPLYWTDNRRSKIVNCTDTLNVQLSKKFDIGIDPDRKDPRTYRRIAKDLSKARTLEEISGDNPSFKLFIDELDRTFAAPPVAVEAPRAAASSDPPIDQ